LERQRQSLAALDEEARDKAYCEILDRDEELRTLIATTVAATPAGAGGAVGRSARGGGGRLAARRRLLRKPRELSQGARRESNMTTVVLTAFATLTALAIALAMNRERVSE
jgi:hypothetical protein